MARFFWDDLLDCLAQQRQVVPVLGSELLTVPGTNGARVPFSTRVAANCARWLQEHHTDLDLPDDAPLSAQLAATRRANLDFAPALYAAHQAALRELTDDALPEPLRLLSEIDVFPFILTTTTDGLVARSLGVRPEHVLATQLDALVDLPMGWHPGQPPRLFQLFGRIELGAEGVVTEEDALEYLAHLHDKGRPVRLLSHLRQSHLLFLGNRFPDWLARVFIRLLRDDRFAGGRRSTFDAVADPEARGATPLVGFLRAYSPKTRIYDDGDAGEFVRTLHAKWRERVGPATPAVPAPVAGDGNVEPEPMGEAAIFLSYASENRAAAEALAAALGAKNLPVWFDRRRLQGGDNFAHKIEENIRRCRLFVPMMSRETADRQEGFFRREWQRARERLETVGPELTFIIPVIVDESDAPGGSDLRRYFTLTGHEPHVLRCPRGVPDSRQLDDFVQKFRAATRVASTV